MPLVTVKTKYQVTLPTSVRKQAGLAVGDVLEAKVVGNKITLTPKGVIDRVLSRALEEVRKGHTYGPFATAEEMIRDLHKRTAQIRRKKKSAKAS
jgi:AbrB family looped-hinge helix DNA binding protein